jgi:hypothetical protein
LGANLTAGLLISIKLSSGSLLEKFLFAETFENGLSEKESNRRVPNILKTSNK